MKRQCPVETPRPAAALPEATEFRFLLAESEAMARAVGLTAATLEEMDAINQMRLVAEAIRSDRFIFHSGS
ncbi:MAG: hypothetical protein Q8N53_07565 [Longimicrobiales bacterium]|nr:hypothetical protein [Longimicrobiales bacterium]